MVFSKIPMIGVTKIFRTGESRVTDEPKVAAEEGREKTATLAPMLSDSIMLLFISLSLTLIYCQFETE